VRWFRRQTRDRGTRVFFATDIHGSEACFRKFLNAVRFYDVDVLILGGDILGKSLVPVVRHADGYRATWRGQDHVGLDERGRAELTTAIRRTGDYVIVLDPEEVAQLDDPEALDTAFRKVVYSSIEEWVALAEERLAGSGTRLLVAPGNDDYLEIDSALQGGDHVVLAENRVLALDDNHEVMTTGYSNLTPWHTERELDEPALRARLDGMARDVKEMSRAVAVIHPPPIASGLDLAPKLDETLRIEMEGGAPVMAPVGSTAVREFLEERQPLLGLHGHVHEGKGTCQIGRTLCVNPGSEFADGVLAGSLLAVGDDRVISHQFVAG
jgi:Icc-related predicted phosphoesterase